MTENEDIWSNNNWKNFFEYWKFSLFKVCT